MTDEAHVALNQVSKRYDGINVLDKIDMRVERGEFVSLLGPSGSGKTTTLMIVAGFERPDGGSVHIAGKLVTDVPAHRRDQGIVFQHYALFPHMTVRRNLEFPLVMRGQGRTQIARQIGETIELMGLSGLEGRLPQQLSGGQQQRVALARAIISRPPVVLMDEPLGALDRNLRDRMKIELKRLQRELGLTVLYVTHDQDEALVMSDRIAIMTGGRIVQIDTPERIYSHPCNQFVASFMGRTNLIDATVSANTVTIEPDFGFIVPGPQIEGGGSVTLSLRPERIALASKPGDDMYAWFGATVEEMMFFGSERHYVVRSGGQKLVSRQLCTADTAFSPGEQIFIGWRPEDATILPGEQG